MDETELDKTEDATPFKLRKAREKGAVARSLDLGFFAALAGAIGFLWIGAAGLAATLGRAASETLVAAGSMQAGPAALGTIAQRLAAPVVTPLLTFAGALFGIALALELFQVGPLFSTTPLKPDFSRINPAKGLKRLFTIRMLVEALKATVKLAVYATVAWLVIGRALTTDRLTLTSGAGLAAALMALTLKLLLFLALAALVFAALDQLYVRRDFAKRMRMSRRELKREHRDREGEPRLKQKRRQLHEQFAQAVKALRGVPGSDIIISNPTHYSVALKYDRRAMAAPTVTARGAGEMARRIKRIGFSYGIVTVTDAPLARALYRAGRIGREIPAELFEGVAGHYRSHGLGRKEQA
ncbi:MAG: EscU/YscU/HrcU family type III secretion system export apparatus switch protein [Novosphingobium sp.]